MSTTAEELDEQIIRLLAERILLPVEAKATAAARPLLRELGVPEYLWESVLTGCAAARTASCLPVATGVKPRMVTIVGGGGAMGRLFAARLEEAGHRTRVLEAGDWDDAAARLGGADLVLIAVPVERTLGVIRKAAGFLAPTTVLADITSMKEPYVQAMLDAHPGPVMGLHPLFGPGVRSFLSQKFVVCRGREEAASRWFLDFLKAAGARLVVCTPAEHDRMMIAIQAIRHFVTLTLGAFLAEEGIDLTRSLEFSSPIYRLELDLVGRLFAQDAALYADIILATPERREAIGRLAAVARRLAGVVRDNDREALIGVFQDTSAAFGSESERALKESEYVINALSVLLAAGKQESD